MMRRMIKRMMRFLISHFTLLLLLTFTISVKAQPYELSYDNGTAEFFFNACVGCIAAVRFSVNSSVQILKLRYFISGETLLFRVHVLNSDFTPIFSRDVRASSEDPHWFEVDISDANVVVNGDFFVGLEWRTPYDSGPRPWLGAETKSPYRRSYLGSFPYPAPIYKDNYLIRVVVQRAPEPPSLIISQIILDPSELTVSVNGVAKPGHEDASITRIHWDWGGWK